MAGLRLTQELEVTGKEALTEVREEAKQTFTTVADQGEQATDKVGDGIESMGGKGAQAFSVLKRGAAALAVAVGTVAASLAAAVKLAEAGANVVAGMDTIRTLGLTAEGMRQVQDALQGTVDKLTAARALRGAALAGLSEGEMVKAAKAASFLAVKLGESKQELLGIVTSGELTDDQLKVLGTSALELDARLASAAAAMGRDLDTMEQRAIKIRFALTAAARATQGWTADTTDAGDQAAKLQSQFADIKNDLLLKILPAVNGFLKTINALVERVQQLDWSKAFDPEVLVRAAEWFRVDLPRIIMDAIGNAVVHAFKAGFAKLRSMSLRDVSSLALRVAKLFVPVNLYPLPSLKADTARVDTLRKRQVAAHTKALDEQFGFTKRYAQATTDYLADQDAKRLAQQRARRAKMLAQLRKEAMEELRGFQSEARTMLRNFDQNFMDRLSTLGGTFSGVVSSMKDIPERFRILGSLPDLREGIRKTVGLTVQQVEAQRQSLGLSERQAKAARLFAVTIRAGMLDMRERVNNEQAINISLRAGLSTLGSQQKISQTMVERFNQIKDVAASTLTVRLASFNLTSRIAKLEAQREQALRRGARRRARSLEAELRVLQFQQDKLGGALSAYLKIAKARKQILDTQLQSARIELRTELLAKLLENARQRGDALQRVASLQQEILGLEGKANVAATARLKAATATRAITLEIVELTRQVTELRAKLDKNLFAFGQEQTLATKRLATLQQVIKRRQQELELIERRRRLESITAARQQQAAADQASLQRSRELADEQARLLNLRTEVARQGFVQPPQVAIMVEAADRLRALRQETASLAQQQQQLQDRLAQGAFGNAAEQQELQAQVRHLQQRIKLRQEEMGLVHQRRDAELQALTVVGSYQRQVFAEAVQFSTRFAGAIKASVEGIVSGVGSFISSMFEGLVTGADNFGITLLKGIFDTLAAVAAQLGSFLILAGTGLTAALIATGPVAIGAGVGLLALSGILKGVGSLISAPPPTPTVTSPAAVSVDTSSLPGPTAQEFRPAESFYAIISPDWNGPPEEQARKFHRFWRRNGGITKASRTVPLF